MRDKNLLFALENGEEFIKGLYSAKEDKIYFLSLDESEKFDNINCYTSSLLCIYEENKIEIDYLVEEITNDKELLNKIKNHPSNKLMFKYNNKDFNNLK